MIVWKFVVCFCFFFFIIYYYFFIILCMTPQRNKQDKSLRCQVSTDHALNYDQAVYLLYESWDDTEQLI